jgi:hypothetical protein
MVVHHLEMNLVLLPPQKEVAVQVEAEVATLQAQEVKMVVIQKKPHKVRKKKVKQKPKILQEIELEEI